MIVDENNDPKYINFPLLLGIDLFKEVSESFQELLFLCLEFISEALLLVLRFGSTGTVSFFSDLFNIEDFYIFIILNIL